MAFTIAQIEEVISSTKSVYTNIELLRNEPNYLNILHYLTGQTTSISPISGGGYGLLCWHNLVNLLDNIETPSSNDQLILDVVYLPALNYIHDRLLEWLDEYLISHMSESSFQAVHNVMKHAGMDDDKMLTHLLFITAGKYYKTDTFENTPLLDFLIENVNKKNTIIHHDKWSTVYFRILEMEQSTLLRDYLWVGIMAKEPHVMRYLLSYDNGKYVADIQELLEIAIPDNDTYWSIMDAMMSLYDQDPIKYASFAVRQGIKYLDFYLANSYHEIAGQFKELTVAGLGVYNCYSTCACYLLLKYELATGIEKSQRILKEKQIIDPQLLRVLYLFLQMDVLPYLKEAILHEQVGLDFTKTVVNLLTTYFEPVVYLPVLWSAVGSKSLLVRNLLVDLLIKNDAEVVEKAIALLEHKEADIRFSAAIILNHFNTATTWNAIQKVLNKEADDNVRDLLLESFCIPEGFDIHAMVAAAGARGKLDKPIQKWLEETELPKLYYKDGSQLDIATTRFLIYRMSRAKGMRSDMEAKLIIVQLDKEKNTPFAEKMCNLFVEKGSKPVLKYLLTLAGLLGGEGIVDQMCSMINNWIDTNALTLVEYGIGALVLQGSDKALRSVEWYHRKYSSKKARIGIAAAQALETAAEEFNTTVYEIGDRIMPDFGFDGLFKVLSVDGKTYRAFIDDDFKIIFFDNNNKKLKSIPAAASLKDELKVIGKEIKDIIKAQSIRLEHYLAIQHKWTEDQWRAVFLSNPITFVYARTILWGIYDSDNNLQQCFLCQEDTTLINFEKDILELPKGAVVGIVHLLHLKDEQVKHWQQRLNSRSVFPQLDRPVFHLAAENKEKTILRDFDGMSAAPDAIKGTLDKYGWQKGKAIGMGVIPDYFKVDDARKIMAVVVTKNLFVDGVDSMLKPELGNVYFVRTSKASAGVFNEPEDESDVRLIPFGQVPAVFYSEVIGGVLAIAKFI